MLISLSFALLIAISTGPITIADETSTSTNQEITEEQKAALVTAIETAKNCKKSALVALKNARANSTSPNNRGLAKTTYKAAIKACIYNLKMARATILQKPTKPMKSGKPAQ